MMDAVFVFDIDGCILDSFTHFNAFVPKVYEKFGLSPDPDLIARLREEIIKLLGGKSSKILILKLILYSAKQMGMGPLQRVKFLFHLKRLYRDNVDAVEYVPGAVEAVRAVKERGFTVAAFTTGSMKDFKRKFATKQEFVHLLDEYTVRDHVKHMKPDPEGLHRILDRLGMRESHRVVMIGDMHHDIQAGIAAGGIGVGVLTGVGTREELEAAGATLVLDSIKDVVPRLDEIVAALP